MNVLQRNAWPTYIHGHPGAGHIQLDLKPACAGATASQGTTLSLNDRTVLREEFASRGRW
jgi:hypothetical protein